MDKNAYSINDVMYVLNATRDTVLKLIKNKELKAFKLGRQWRVIVSSLDDYIRSKSNY
mgnify:CR=1 FL=1